MSIRVAVDTSILSLALDHVWSKKFGRDADEPDRAMRAYHALQLLASDKYELRIPSVVMAELTLKFDGADDPEHFRGWLPKADIRPFDDPAVHRMAELSIPKPGHGKSKRELKCDLLIAATALQSKCAELWTADRDFTSILKGHDSLRVRNLEELAALSEAPLFDSIADVE